MGGDELIAEMDRALSEGAILQFRRMAHAKAEEAKKKLLSLMDGSAPAGYGAASSSPGTKAASRTWVGWMMGAAPATPLTPAASSSSLLLVGGGAGSEDMKADMSKEEWEKLESLLAEQVRSRSRLSYGPAQALVPQPQRPST